VKARFLVLLAAAFTLAVLASSPGNAVGVGKTCGGLPNIPSDAGLFCQNKAGTCGVADVAGKCAKVPQVCPKSIRKVCGCDGKTYNNDCERQMAKVSMNHKGACK
jgi:hypothetical protein